MAVFYNIDLLSYNSEYLSVQQTKNLKGIFTLIVLFHHLAIFASVGDVYNIFAKFMKNVATKSLNLA